MDSAVLTRSIASAVVRDNILRNGVAFAALLAAAFVSLHPFNMLLYTLSVTADVCILHVLGNRPKFSLWALLVFTGLLVRASNSLCPRREDFVLHAEPDAQTMLLRC